MDGCCFASSLFLRTISHWKKLFLCACTHTCTCIDIYTCEPWYRIYAIIFIVPSWKTRATWLFWRKINWFGPRLHHSYPMMRWTWTLLLFLLFLGPSEHSSGRKNTTAIFTYVYECTEWPDSSISSALSGSRCNVLYICVLAKASCYYTQEMESYRLGFNCVMMIVYRWP